MGGEGGVFFALVGANIKQCCFRTECNTQRGGRCNVFFEMMRFHDMLDPPKHAGGKRKANSPTDAQLAQREVEKDAITAKRREIQCHAHVRGCCTNGDKCTAQHTTDPVEIMCNSTVEPSEKAGIKNLTYGWCHLVAKGIECPYKECLHRVSIETPESEPQAAAADAPVAVEEELPSA